MRLLLLHGPRIFRGQFRAFYTASSLPALPIFAQYDRLLALRTLSDELLDDLMPRVRRQLSLQTDQARLVEDAPTRGAIDWRRTMERGWRETPGLPPISFETRLRQRSTATPENLFTVAVLLAYRTMIRRLLEELIAEEALVPEERHELAAHDEQAERELAAPYARALASVARQSDIRELAAQVEARLRPGPNPYRDLLDWWRRFDQLHVGRGAQQQGPVLAPQRDDDKANAWLYELWIMLELLHLLDDRQALAPVDVTTDRLQATFALHGQQLRLTYNRQAEATKGDDADWQHSPGVRPDYTLERVNALSFAHDGALIWREAPVVLDAKYYLGRSEAERTHDPIKKLLADMTLLGAEQCVLFFPQLSEPEGGQHITRTVERARGRHPSADLRATQIHLCHLAPDAALDALQLRLSSVLDQLSSYLARRPAQIACHGVCLDPDTISPNPLAYVAMHHILCPKPHIGVGVYDLVDRATDCLKNPLVCHVIGQAIVPPFVVRASTSGELHQKTGELRARSDEALRDLERGDDDERGGRAEQLRSHIFTGVGRSVEQYVKLRGNTKTIEEYLESWVFGAYWKLHPRALAPETRSMLISGEYVWQEYAQSEGLGDWAAPAIQYCRAVELELRRRLYNHHPGQFKVGKSRWTFGTPVHAYGRGDVNAHHNWNLLITVVNASGSDEDAFEALFRRIVDAKLKEKRNHLAHGEATPRTEAQAIRGLLIGSRGDPGVLCWLAEHLDPA
jgi:hypothetical protein